MKKLSYLFYLLFISFGLYSQCPSTIPGSGIVYEVSPPIGNLKGFDFGNQFQLFNLVGNNYGICSDRLVTDGVNNHVGTVIDGEFVISVEDSPNPEDIMCYFHLDNAWTYVSNSDYASILPTMLSILEFDPVLNDGGNTEDTPQLQVSIPSSGSTDLPMVEYSKSSANNYNALALDGFAIVSGFFQFLHEASDGVNANRAKSQGVDHALSNYFAGRYMVDNLFSNANDITGYTYGGLVGGESTNVWRTIKFSLGELYLEHGVLSKYFVEDEFDKRKAQPKSELLTATLWQLGKGLGFGKIDQLLSQNYILFNDGYITNQANFGVRLYNIVADIVENPNNNEFSHDDLCYMYKVFGFVYGDAFFGDGELNTNAYEGVLDLDYIIRDSYQGQSSWQYGDQAEDVGNEENEETRDFSRSPDIWNKVDIPTNNDKNHENPEYDGVSPNYLYVDVRLESCEEPSADDELHVYIRESHLTSIWPLDWTAGYDDPTDTNTPLIGYEITDIANNPLFIDQNTMGVGRSMINYVSLHMEQYEDKFYKVYRYEIPWIPLNPADLPEYEEEEAEPWACLLARVVSSEDVMANELSGVTAWDNNVANNNIAIRNTSILTSAGFTGGGGTGGGSVSGLNIKSPYTVTGTPGNNGGGTGTPTATNAPLAIAIGVHPNNDYTDYGDPIIPATTGPGDPVIF